MTIINLVKGDNAIFEERLHLENESSEIHIKMNLCAFDTLLIL